MWSLYVMPMNTYKLFTPLCYMYCCNMCLFLFQVSTFAYKESLLRPANKSVKPNTQFLEKFAALKEVKWESLASLLSLTSTQIEEVRRRGEGPQDCALMTLKMWAARDDATYGQLCHLLRTISLLHY